MSHPNKRRRKNETRDNLYSDDEGDDEGFMNTRESRFDNRGRLFSIAVSPQKKSVKQPWATRRVWDPPDDIELGLDTDTNLYDQTVEAEVYDAPPVDAPPVEVLNNSGRKPKHTLRAVGLKTRWKYGHCMLIDLFSSYVLTSIGVRSINKSFWTRYCGTMDGVLQACSRRVGTV